MLPHWERDNESDWKWDGYPNTSAAKHDSSWVSISSDIRGLAGLIWNRYPYGQNIVWSREEWARYEREGAET